MQNKFAGTNLVRKESIEELCGHRARALELYRAALDTLNEARAAHSRASHGQLWRNAGAKPRRPTGRLIHRH